MTEERTSLLLLVMLTAIYLPTMGAEKKTHKGAKVTKIGPPMNITFLSMFTYLHCS